MTDRTQMDPFELRVAGLLNTYAQTVVHPFEPLEIARSTKAADAQGGVLARRRPIFLDRRLVWSFLLAALVVAGAALALVIGTSQPPTDPGRLVFIRDGDIWVAEGDGSGQTKIAEGASEGTKGDYLTAAWSPDGRQIAAVRNADDAAPTQRIEFLTAEGAKGATFEPENAGIQSVSWSPDGSRLAVALRSAEGPTYAEPPFDHLTELRLWIVGSDGASPSEIAQPWEWLAWPGADLYVLDLKVRWSPDDRWIALNVLTKLSDRGWGGVWHMVAADGSGARPPIAIEGEVDWSPDGRQLAIAGVIEGCPASFSQPQYKPDQVACLGVVGVDGGPVTSLVEPTNLEAADDGDHTTYPEDFGLPRFSPDGGRIAFQSRMEYWAEKPSAEDPYPEIDGELTRLYVHDLDSDTLHRLASGTESLTERDAVGTLVNLADVTGEPVALGSIRWSPDGRRLLFLSREAGGPPASWSIRSVDAAGGSPSTVLVEGVQAFDLGYVR